MPIAHSRVTAQGQISIPAEVRKHLGLGPGSVLEWERQGEEIVVRRAGKYSSAEIHAALFGSGGSGVRKTPEQMDEAVRTLMRKRRARR